MARCVRNGSSGLQPLSNEHRTRQAAFKLVPGLGPLIASKFLAMLLATLGLEAIVPLNLVPPFERNGLLGDHNIDAIYSEATKPSAQPRGTRTSRICSGKLELTFPTTKEDDAPDANTTWHGRSAFLWGGGAYGSRRGTGARIL